LRERPGCGAAERQGGTCDGGGFNEVSARLHLASFVLSNFSFG
jgi:hypothetical protein